ncbi:MAG: lipopolysaccharide transport periplasmic protein LptA [Burkholderiales bacterium]|nr:lipopolysaccharide transport periplasmic protein LptA [Burkholderiales bacterium]
MHPAPAPRPTRLTARLLTGLAVLVLAAPAGAERADRSKPMEIVSDGQQSATVDLKSRVTVISGNVVITQGTLQIKADRVEVREDTPGRFHATAIGSSGRPATFRQKRDRVDEYVEAEAARVEYDGAAERVRFVGDAQLRVLRPSGPPDEASAAVITYEQRSDTITFEGGAPATPGAAPGRARLVFIPRAAEPAASEPAR